MTPKSAKLAYGAAWLLAIAVASPSAADILPGGSATGTKTGAARRGQSPEAASSEDPTVAHEATTSAEYWTESASCAESSGPFSGVRCWLAEQTARYRARNYNTSLKLHHWLSDQTYKFRFQNYATSRRLQKRTYHEVAPPYWEPTYGYHQTCWRRFPECCDRCPPADALSPIPEGESPLASPLAPVPSTVPPVPMPDGEASPQPVPAPPANEGDASEPNDAAFAPRVSPNAGGVFVQPVLRGE